MSKEISGFIEIGGFKIYVDLSVTDADTSFDPEKFCPPEDVSLTEKEVESAQKALLKEFEKKKAPACETCPQQKECCKKDVAEVVNKVEDFVEEEITEMKLREKAAEIGGKSNANILKIKDAIAELSETKNLQGVKKENYSALMKKFEEIENGGN